MTEVRKYPLVWRILHWLMAVMVLSLIPVGLWMTSRGEADIWGELTNALYSSHKALGFSVLLLMIVRMLFKLFMHAPEYPSDFPDVLQKAAKGLHHALYLLLFATPLFGWAGVTAYPALITWGGDLPAMPLIPVDQGLAEHLFAIHGTLAMILAVLIVGHIAAALRHMVRKDGIFRRMW